MSREILFKAKRIKDRKWIEGFPVKKYGAWFIYDAKNADTCRQNNYVAVKGTICEYTGEMDQDGKRIFEGDILEAHLDERHPEDITHVEVAFENGAWMIKEKGFEAARFESGEGKEWKVIGNIFDSPELLEENTEKEE